jgi:hypothetical protein
VVQNQLQHNWDVFAPTFRLNLKFYDDVNDCVRENGAHDGCAHDGCDHALHDVSDDDCEVTATFFKVK